MEQNSTGRFFSLSHTVVGIFQMRSEKEARRFYSADREGGVNEMWGREKGTSATSILRFDLKTKILFTLELNQ